MERRKLALLRDFFLKAPEEDALTEKSVGRYAGRVDGFNPKNHELQA